MLLPLGRVLQKERTNKNNRMCVWGQGVRRIETDLFKGTVLPNYGHWQF